MLNIQIRLPLLCPGSECRSHVFCKFKSGIHQIGLVQLRSDAVDLAAELSVQISLICHDARRDQRLPHFSTEDNEDLSELSVPGLVHDAEDAADHGLLVQIQLQQLAAQLALVVPDVVLDEPDCPVRFLLVEVIGAVFDAVDDDLVQQTDPDADKFGAVPDRLVICEDVVIHSRP